MLLRAHIRDLKTSHSQHPKAHLVDPSRWCVESGTPPNPVSVDRAVNPSGTRFAIAPATVLAPLCPSAGGESTQCWLRKKKRPTATRL